MTCTVRVLMPAPALNSSCVSSVVSLVNAAVLSAAASATTVTGGVPRCAQARVAQGRALQGGGADCTGALQLVNYDVPVIVAASESSSAALAGVKALNSASFSAAALLLANLSGCPAATLELAGVGVTATCGTLTAAQGQCDLSVFEATPAPMTLTTSQQLGLGLGITLTLAAIILAVTLAYYRKAGCCKYG